MSFPIIDISRINDEEEQVRLVNEITLASSQWGFLLLKGHGIATADVENMFDLSKEFFALPADDKDPYPITSQTIGYSGSFTDRVKDDKMSMWFGGTPGALSENQNSLPPFWRQHIEPVEAFKHQCHTLIMKLLECFALALNLPDRNFFADAHREDAGDGNSLRMILYPARTEQPDFPGMGSRMAEHTDSGSVTLLFQSSDGLEVMSPTGEWVKAPHVEDCILVNFGDALSFWSSGQLKATLHRVTFDGLPYNRQRQTMAYFAKASPDTVLQPIDPGRNGQRYFTNGFEILPGMTVGEVSKKVMQNIYGPALAAKDNTVEILPHHQSSTATAR
jgi:isopenicillin N synthase-like dioxygenase